MQIDDVSVFGVKDYNGNLQNIYAVQTNNAIYTIKTRRIVRIQSADQTIVFNYDNTNNQYSVLLVSKNNSYEIPSTYQNPNITFPTPVFEFSQDETPPKIFTGVLVEFSNRINGRSIVDGTLAISYFDANNNNKNAVMWNMGGGRYYAPLPTNDTTFDKLFNKTKFLSTTSLQSEACAQLFQTYPIADICSKAPESDKTLCTLIMQEMTVNIPNALRKASRNIELIPWQSQSFDDARDMEVIAYVPGQDLSRIPLNASNLSNVTRRSISPRKINSSIWR